MQHIFADFRQNCTLEGNFKNTDGLLNCEGGDEDPDNLLDQIVGLRDRWDF